MKQYTIIKDNSDNDTQKEKKLDIIIERIDKDHNDDSINYNFSLPSKTDIFSNINLKDFPEDKAKKQLMNFMFLFKKKLQGISLNSTHDFSHLLASKMDDGCIVLVWNCDHIRVNLFFEQDPSESSYTIVSDNGNKGEFSTLAGRLDNDQYDNIIVQILNIVLE